MPDLETPNTIRGNIIACRELISPYSNEARYQLGYGTNWIIEYKTQEEFEELCEGLNILEIIGNDGPLTTKVVDFDNLTPEEKSSIKVITEPNSDEIYNTINGKGVINPTINLIFKDIDQTSFDDLKKSDEENSDVNTLLVLPAAVYEKIFGNKDDFDTNDYLEYSEEDYSDDISASLIKYHIIDILKDSEDRSYASVLNNIVSETNRNLQSFKTNETDVVRLFTRNEEKFESDLDSLYGQLENLNSLQLDYLTAKTSIEESLELTASALDEKNTEIAEYENSHKRLPDGVNEGVPYFAYDFLDSEEKEEYDLLNSQLHTLLANQEELNNNLSENELNNKADEIDEVQNQINHLNTLHNSSTIGLNIPLEYLTEVDNTSYVQYDDLYIPDGYFIFIKNINIQDDEKDFTDNEEQNIPYYYFIGKQVNREINGTTQPCIALMVINEYYSLKSFMNLKTYFNFDKILLISSDIKNQINSLRNQIDNKLPDENQDYLINNEFSIPLEDISELIVSDSGTIIPSLSVLLVEGDSNDDNNEGGDGGNDNEPTNPNPDDTEDDEYKEYLKGGNIYIINGITFVIPENSPAAKRIVFVNGYYYILLTSCYIYKLDVDFNIVTTIDLTKISSDITKTDIFSIGNMLIIQSDKTYVTDLESVKNNYGIADTDVVIDSKKINTKTIVKVTITK